MAVVGEVLVAIMNNQADLAIAQQQHWYRIPKNQVEKLTQRGCWAPTWLAFYQSKGFAADAWTVRYYAQIQRISEVARWELFPDQVSHPRQQARYYKLELAELEQLPRPIVSRRLRRITFIPTTWEKFMQAQEINELWRAAHSAI